MIFTNKIKTSVIKFFNYVENDLITLEKESESIQFIKNKLTEGREDISRGRWGIAFENLASALVENYIILDRKGVSIAKEAIERCKLDSNWILKLRRLDSDGYIKGSWSLVDCEKLAEEYKYTFYKPSRKITEQLEIGNIVKLNFQFESTNDKDSSGERMWVIITEKSNGKFKGTLDNNPFFISDFYYKDIIEFEHKHIIDHDLDITEPNLVNKYHDRCFVTNKILYEEAPINYIYREEPMEKDNEGDYVDSGWRFLSGDELDEYMDNPDNLSFVSLGCVLRIDDSFINLLESEIGTSYERNQISGKFELTYE